MSCSGYDREWFETTTSLGALPPSLLAVEGWYKIFGDIRISHATLFVYSFGDKLCRWYWVLHPASALNLLMKTVFPLGATLQEKVLVLKSLRGFWTSAWGALSSETLGEGRSWWDWWWMMKSFESLACIATLVIQNFQWRSLLRMSGLSYSQLLICWLDETNCFLYKFVGKVLEDENLRRV